MIYKIVYAICRFCLFFVLRIKIKGRENIPSGAALVVANHTSYLDPVLVCFAFGWNPNLAIMTKAEMIRIPIFGAVLKGCGAFPVQRGKSDVRAIRLALGALKDGKKLLIFPEGTRVKDRDDAEAKAGSGMLAVRTNVPILPVYVTPFRRLFTTLQVIIGPSFQIRNENLHDGESYQRAASDMMEKVRELGRSSV